MTETADKRVIMENMIGRDERRKERGKISYHCFQKCTSY